MSSPRRNLDQNTSTDQLDLLERTIAFMKAYWRYIAALGTGLLAGGGVAVLGVLFVPGLNIVAAGLATVALIASAAVVAAALVTGFIVGGIKLFQYLSRDKREEVGRPLEQVAEPVAGAEPAEPAALVVPTEPAVAAKPAVSVGPAEPALPPMQMTSGKVDVTPQSFVKHTLFAIPVVPLPDEGNVVLADGTQVSKEKVDAVCEKLRRKVIDTQSKSAFSFIHKACETPDGHRILKAHSKTLAKFRSDDVDDDNDYPIINSNNTIDDETRRIILCATKIQGAEIEIVDPVLHAPALKI